MRFAAVLPVCAVIVLNTISCRKNDQTASSDTICIEPAVAKATDTNFETSDQIGLTVVRGGAAYVTNAPLTFDGTKFSGSAKWYRETGETSGLIAYYPYSQSGVPTTFSVSANQKISGIKSSDLMVATASEVVPSAVVPMTFYHQLSKINIDVKNTTQTAISFVTIKNTMLSANIDIEKRTVSPLSDSVGDIETFPLSDGSGYCAILIPQTVCLKVEVKMSDNSVKTTEFSEVTLSKGCCYSLSVDIR